MRFRIPIAITVVVLALFALTVSLGSKPAPQQKEANTTTVASNTFTDQREKLLYLKQQQQLKAAVRDYFDKAIATGEIVGAGLSIVRGDSIVISAGFGKRNSRSQEEVDGQTIFRLGSLSKGFAGVLAARLVQEGQLDWRLKVSDCIPGFQLGDRSNTGKITLAHILSHTSGAPYHSFTNLVEAGLPLADIAQRFTTVTPISTPGSLYSYQNALFALSGEIIYRATGQSITTALEQKFMIPLGMCSTLMEHEALLNEDNVAIPHSRYRQGWRPTKLTDHYYNAVAAGGINASSTDMARWMRFLLGHNPDVMGKSAIEEAFNPFIEISGHSKYYQRWPGHVASYYGFGWRIHRFTEGGSPREKTIWHHGGSVNNYRNEIAVYPEADLGICVLLNNNSRLARTVIPDLYEIVQKVYEQPEVNIASNNTPNPIPQF
jgi:beta-lactamase class C